MGFRFRKSVKLGKGVRINFSKSGVGWSVGGKGFRVTKKARGGYRTTSSIHGTGISYSQDFGKKKNNSGNAKKTTSTVYTQQNNSSQKVNEINTIENPLQTLIVISVLISLWFFYFVPTIIGIYMLYTFCKQLNQMRENNMKKCGENTEFFIINEKLSQNITFIVLLMCFWFLVFPIFIAIKKVNLFMGEFRILKKYEESELLELQKLLVKNSEEKLICSKSELYEMAQETISNNMRIIKESQNIVENTKDIDTFFTRINLILYKYEEICLFEPYIDFEGHSPSEAYEQEISECENETKHFIYQYIAYMLESAQNLKTERGRFSRYQKAYESFRSHYDTISHENQVRIETEFQKILII